MNSTGSSRRLDFATFDLNGVPASAASCSLSIRRPDGTLQVVHPAAVEAGRYLYDIKFDQAGFWSWVWLAGGASALDRTESGATLVSAKRSSAPPHSWASMEDMRASPSIAKLAEASTLDEGFLERCGFAATEFLQSRSWRRFRGLAEVELRPCCSCAYGRGFSGIYSWPIWSMAVAAMTMGDTLPPIEGPAPCGCSVNRELQLPDDTRLVSAVFLDGVLFTDWRLDPGGKLVRTDGPQWPCCNHIEDPEATVGVLSVHAVLGTEEYEIARMAASELGVELYLSQRDPAASRTPTRVTNVQRQGVNYTRVDTKTLAEDGSTGLRVTDIFLSQYGKRRKRMSMASPDVSETARQIGTRA